MVNTGNIINRIIKGPEKNFSVEVLKFDSMKKAKEMQKKIHKDYGWKPSIFIVQGKYIIAKANNLIKLKR